MKYVTIINDKQYEVEIDKDGNVLLNGELRDVDFLALGETLYSVIMNDESKEVVIERDGDVHNVLMGGRLFEARVLDERALLMAMRKGGLGGGSGEVKAPMPGLIVVVPVEIGQEVEANSTVVILESMKMQNELKTPIAGVVTSINVEQGQTVDKNEVLIVIEAPEDDE